ncbi:glycosyltransferase [Leeuwenhoekiella marinoflava]|uniref:Glycosyltransferase involved in cell wall biosynthesis n=2 Tax=Leeuwenhoekiella marinoflava TaxID=988 RepID=A0A4V1KRT1_9FLAO|nr:glycosyltransferase [Leeuwenhoekiella marinoflava]RXG25992.1 glycosyltransferase involved in cell wall biosynthesis [Leeuwenhoekiella marinoflava]SHF75256.1 Glycosyltransferase involved in cell wall bisynthesis [Leeuwenhoekiella marinoflava DSM 3653]
MKIVFDPIESESNQYPQMLVSGFQKQGLEVYSLNEMLSDLNKFKSVSVVHLNWFESVKSSFAFLKKFVKLICLILGGKKIVWTMHNKTPHIKKVFLLQKILLRILKEKADVIIIHSTATKELLYKESPRFAEKTVYIPHPNYIGVYGSATQQKDFSNEPLQLLFLGAVKPYKNIELLIEAVQTFSKEEVELTIAGKCYTMEYEEFLNQKISKNNIRTNFQFLEDGALKEALEDHELVILPYDLRSSLNSGTVILAFSYARSVICPEIGTVRDVKNKKQILGYSYGDEHEHKEQLILAIKRAINLKQKSPQVFEEWGVAMQQEMKDFNDPKLISEAFLDLYANL